MNVIYSLWDKHAYCTKSYLKKPGVHLGQKFESHTDFDEWVLMLASPIVDMNWHIIKYGEI